MTRSRSQSATFATVATFASALAGAFATDGLRAQKPEATKTPGMTWHENLAAAHAASANDGKPVVAYFTFET